MYEYQFKLKKNSKIDKFEGEPYGEVSSQHKGERRANLDHGDNDSPCKEKLT